MRMSTLAVLLLVLWVLLTILAGCQTTASCNMGDHSAEWNSVALLRGCAEANRRVGR